MSQTKKYLAFISYKHDDKEWAKWLQQKIESYKLPVYITDNYPDLPKRLHPIFRDETDLELGTLAENIRKALAESRFLIVVCSPNAVKSKYVSDEITVFKELGGTDRIIPIIVDGQPLADNHDQECIPEPLRKDVSGGLLAANVHELNKDYALVKVIAKMLDLNPDMLWQRHLVAEEEEKRRIIEQRNNLLRTETRFLAEKSVAALSEGDSYGARLSALAGLPEDLLDDSDRPYVPEAEAALRSACESENAIFYGNFSGGLCCNAVSPDGKRLAAVDNGTLCVWEVETGRIMIEENRNYSLHSVAFSNDGGKIVYVGDEGITIIDAYTGDYVKSFSGDDVFAYYSAVFCPGDKALLLLSEWKKVFVMDIETGECLHTFFDGATHTWTRFATFSHNGEMIAIGSQRKDVTIWDSKSYKLIRKLPVTGKSAAFSDDDRYLITVSYKEKSLRIWDIQSGKCEVLKDAHKAEVNSVASGIGNGCFVSGSQDGTVCVWEHKTLVKNTKYPAAVNWLTCDPNGQSLFAALDDRTVRLAKEGKSSLLLELPGEGREVSGIGFNETKKCVMSVSHDFFVRVWETETGECVQKQKDGFLDCVGSPDGRFYLTNTVLFKRVGEWPIQSASFYTVHLHSVETGEVIRDFEGHTDMIMCAAFSSNGKYLATGSEDGTVRVWDIETGDCIHVLKHGEGVNQLAFGINDTRIASGGYSVCIWDVETGQEIKRLPSIGSLVGCVQFSNDGNYFLTKSLNLCYVYMTDWGRRLFIRDEGAYLSMLTPDSKRILTDKEDKIVVRDSATGQVLMEMKGHSQDIVCGTCSPDGNYLATASRDKTIRVWHIESGVCVKTYNQKTEDIRNIAFGDEGRMVVSGHDRGELRLFDFPPLQDLIDQTRERFKDRPLTPEERRQYYLE